MHHERLVDALSRLHPLDADFKKALEKATVVMTLPKGHFLLEAPKISDHLFFLNYGFAAAFSFDTEGEKRIEAFWKEHQLVIATQSFLHQAPSTEFIQLCEKSEVVFLSYGKMQELLHTYKTANMLYRIIVERHYHQGRQRYKELLRLSAEERFNKLLTIFPRIEQRVPQDYIASYLGITPQSLSRIKRNANPNNTPTDINQ